MGTPVGQQTIYTIVYSFGFLHIYTVVTGSVSFILRKAVTRYLLVVCLCAFLRPFSVNDAEHRPRVRTLCLGEDGMEVQRLWAARTIAMQAVLHMPHQLEAHVGMLPVGDPQKSFERWRPAWVAAGRAVDDCQDEHA